MCLCVLTCVLCMYAPCMNFLGHVTLTCAKQNLFCLGMTPCSQQGQREPGGHVPCDTVEVSVPSSSIINHSRQACPWPPPKTHSHAHARAHTHTLMYIFFSPITVYHTKEKRVGCFYMLDTPDYTRSYNTIVQIYKYQPTQILIIIT